MQPEKKAESAEARQTESRERRISTIVRKQHRDSTERDDAWASTRERHLAESLVMVRPGVLELKQVDVDLLFSDLDATG